MIDTVISVFYYLRVIVPMVLRAPVGTEPVGTEPVGTEPVGTEPVGTEPVGTEPVDAKSVATLGNATAAVGLIVALSTLVAGVLAEPLLASSVSTL